MKIVFLFVFFSAVAFSAEKPPKYTCKAWREARNQVRYVPYITDGKFRGYIIRDLKSDSILAKEGLEELDLLTEMDGVPLTLRTDLKALLKTACVEKPLGSFFVMRRATPRVISVPLDKKER